MLFFNYISLQQRLKWNNNISGSSKRQLTGCFEVIVVNFIKYQFIFSNKMTVTNGFGSLPFVHVPCPLHSFKQEISSIYSKNSGV